ncbi:hypothetical protein MTO96_033269 [Rhipicephalus appendiculatus]
MESPACYHPSAEAKQSTDAAAAMGARAEPRHTGPRHQRTLSFGYIQLPPAHCGAPRDTRDELLKWRANWEDKHSRGLSQAKGAPPAIPDIVVPRERSPDVPEDSAAAEIFPPLPAPSEEEDMSASRKRPRHEISSDDKAGAPRKLVLASPSTHEDATNSSTTSLLTDVSDSSQDSSTTTGDALASKQKTVAGRGTAAASSTSVDQWSARTPAWYRGPPGLLPTDPRRRLPLVYSLLQVRLRATPRVLLPHGPAAPTPFSPAETAMTVDSAVPSVVPPSDMPAAHGPAATTEAQRSIDSLVEILLHAIACATLSPDHPLHATCLQAMALQTTTTKHG